jgi:hypothetical protein
MGDAAMSSAKPVLGCLVFLAAAVGFVISNHIVDAMIPSKASQSGSPMGIPDPGDRPFDAESSISTGRRCVDLNGHRFGWNWPNIPFGTTACSDTGQKTDK